MDISITVLTVDIYSAPKQLETCIYQTNTVIFVSLSLVQPNLTSLNLIQLLLVWMYIVIVVNRVGVYHDIRIFSVTGTS